MASVMGMRGMIDAHTLTAAPSTRYATLAVEGAHEFGAGALPFPSFPSFAILGSVWCNWCDFQFVCQLSVVLTRTADPFALYGEKVKDARVKRLKMDGM